MFVSLGEARVQGATFAADYCYALVAISNCLTQRSASRKAAVRLEKAGHDCALATRL